MDNKNQHRQRFIVQTVEETAEPTTVQKVSEVPHTLPDDPLPAPVSDEVRSFVDEVRGVQSAPKTPVVMAPEPQPTIRHRPVHQVAPAPSRTLESLQKGSLRSQLLGKVQTAQVAPEKQTLHVPEPQAEEQELKETSASFVNPNLEKFPEWFTQEQTPAPNSVSRAEPVVSRTSSTPHILEQMSEKIKGMNAFVMNAPAFVTIALILSVSAFMAGRFSAVPSKQVGAQESLATIDMTKTQKTAGAPITQTPNEIIASVREEFTLASDISKNPDATLQDKDVASKKIVAILDLLSRGIESYPDVASLYFERAQVEKMVMKSAPTLEAQANTDYQKAIELSPLTASFYAGYGEYFELIGKADEALVQYDKSLKLDPKLADVWYAKGKINAQKGQVPEALAAYDEVLKLIPQASARYLDLKAERDNLAASVQPPIQ